jgi:hypothetical protein
VIAAGLRCGIKAPKQAFQYCHEQEALKRTARHDLIAGTSILAAGMAVAVF